MNINISDSENNSSEKGQLVKIRVNISNFLNK